MSADDVLNRERRALLTHLSGRVWSAIREELGTTGQVPPPTLRLCNDEAVRSVRCRPFARGADAAEAIDGLRLVPRRDDDWAEFWTWERNDLSVALGYSTEPFALQSLRCVYFGEMELGTQEFDVPGGIETLFFRSTRASSVHSRRDLPRGVRDIIFGSADSGGETLPQDETVQRLRDRGYKFGIEWRRSAPESRS